MVKENKEVPIEAAVKWLIKERDRYKEKLDTIVPYTKSLETRVRDLEKLIEGLGDCPMKRIEKLEKENRRLIEEKTFLIQDYQKSDWYKSMQVKAKKKDERIHHLRESLLEAMVKLNEYEKGNKPGV